MEIIHYHHNSRLTAEIADLCQIRPHKRSAIRIRTLRTHTQCMFVRLFTLRGDYGVLRGKRGKQGETYV